MDPEIDQGQSLTQAPRLDIDADIQFGQMLVTDQAPNEIDSRGVDYDHHHQETDSAEGGLR